MEIRSLENTSFDTLFEAFNAAFAGYEVQLDKTGLQTMLKRRGFNPALSFAAFEGDKIVSFTCNGTGNYYGVRTAYDTGTGTVEAYRGKGLATRIFETSIPYLREAGIKEYLLEVLQHNTGAVSVYKKLGFEVTREFYYFRAGKGGIRHKVTCNDPACTLRPIDINRYEQIPGFRDFKPSWQNSLEAVNRSPEDFICLGVFIKDKLVGYGVSEPVSGDITQIAVDKAYRRRGIGSLLFQKIIESAQPESVKIVNTDIHCNSVTAFLKAKNIEPSGKQYEMVRRIVTPQTVPAP